MKKENLAFLSLKTSNLKVLVIGGGKAGYIKVKSFLQKGCTVTLITKDISKEISQIETYDKLTIINEDFNCENHYDLIKKCHLVIIATNNKELNCKIRKLCDDIFRLYIDCTEVEKSLCITPTMGQSEEIIFALHTKDKSPKTSVFLRNILEKEFEKYDDYVKFSVNIRNSLNNLKDKKEIMDFISSYDFLYMFNKGYGEKILNLFYGGLSFENSNKKK